MSRTLNLFVTKLNERHELTVPDVSVEWLLAHGLHAKVNDAHANIKREAFKSDEEWVAAIKAKIDPVIKQIVDGTLPPRRDSAVITNEAAMRQLGLTPEEWAIVQAARAKAEAKKKAAA